jgi:Mg-chelatase subunit ChlD
MHVRGERGAVMIAIALFLMIMLCFVAFGTEAGRWYLLRAEISKTVDAAALAGARNISNPYVDPRVLAAEFCAENFPAGAFGTPGAGAPGAATFNVELQPDDRIAVDGRATSPAILAQLLGISEVPVSSAGAAQMRPVEIMMILDRSGSMGYFGGQPMADLKLAAKSFLDFFADTQNRDKIGLITFARSSRVDHALSTNFVAPMKTAIDAMVATGNTNPEDAIDKADGPGGLTDQSGIPQSARIKQFAIFFSDGRPNSFRGLFTYRGATYDAVVVGNGDCVNGNCDPSDRLWRHDIEATLPVAINPRRTGDGLRFGSRCGNDFSVRWQIFDQYPVPGYGATTCNIPVADLGEYLCAMSADFAVQHAEQLKDRGITVFAIGLGDESFINRGFLERIASTPEQVYIAPSSDDLVTLFQRVAKDIKLRLVM